MNSQGLTTKSAGAEKSLFELALQAIKEIELKKGSVIQFCGPISTGGFGNIDENIECISSTIQAAEKIGIPVFNQMAYERRMDLILENHTGYDYPLLEFFYKPILESGKIGALLFLPLWETSVGSKWEHDFAKSINIPVFYLEGPFIVEIRTIYEKIKSPS